MKFGEHFTWQCHEIEFAKRPEMRTALCMYMCVCECGCYECEWVCLSANPADRQRGGDPRGAWLPLPSTCLLIYAALSISFSCFRPTRYPRFACARSMYSAMNCVSCLCKLIYFWQSCWRCWWLCQSLDKSGYFFRGNPETIAYFMRLYSRYISWLPNKGITKPIT